MSAETGFDDLFDDGVYRAAQTTFQGRAHPLKPQGQTHYRGASRPARQGLPAELSSAHWGRLPAFGRPPASRRTAVHADPRGGEVEGGFEAQKFRFAG